jgi:hypothetical protein
MVRLLIALDPGVGVGPTELAAAWNVDAEAQAAGSARAEETSGEDFFPSLVEFVVIPLLVNVGSNAVYDLLKKLMAKVRPGHHSEQRGLELTEVTTGEGDRLIVVRMGGTPS